MTQPPRLRRDPRDPASMRARAPAASPAGVAQPAGRVHVEDPACLILAVVDLDAGRMSRDDRELMGAARHLADILKGAVVMVACLSPAAPFRARPEQEGADRVALLRDDRYADDLAEPRVGGVLAVAGYVAARHILFSGSAMGGELARRVAARLGDRPAFDVRRLSGEGVAGDIDAGLTEVHRPRPCVIVTARAAFAPVEPVPAREARALAIQVPSDTAPRVRSLGPLPLDPATVPLAEADLIISAGSGLTDWDSFHRAASALGAAEAGSRVVCDAGLLPRSRQVGASGLLIEPRCYLAFGIAGASQHLQGIAGAERVIAVNTDLRADMVKRADLSIVADAQAILPALLRRAAARSGTPGSTETSCFRADRSEAGVVDTGPPPPGMSQREILAEGEVVALVSCGRHPVSKRPRRADRDARALELALGCSPSVMAVHAGPPDPGISTLRDAFGAGAASLVLVDCPAEGDPLPALADHLRERAPRLIVAGARAEAGECSGMTPFWLAERLGYGLATDIVQIELHDGATRLVQALPGGRRRVLETSLPLVVTVDRTGPEPRLSARMRALRGAPEVRPGGAGEADERTRWSTRPGRPRPKRLAAPKALRAGAEDDGRREMVAPDPEAAAEAILDFLERDGLLGPNLSGRTRETVP